MSREPLVRLYGRVLTQSSLSVVTEGFRSALAAEGILAGVYGIDTRHIAGCDDNPDDHAGTTALHGIYTGPLNCVGEMLEGGRHEHYWVMVAPNSDRLPEWLVQRFKGYIERYGDRLHFMAPSAWASRQLAKILGPSIAVLSVPHGVSEDYHPYPEISADVARRYAEEGEFRVLHFSTSAQSRKGTFELIQAWMSLRLSEHANGKERLVCILDYPAKLALQGRLSEEGVRIDDSVSLNNRADLPPGNLARVLASAHLVCQPSRGEAFGLVPLQALCTGVPVAATLCTGHSEYLKADTPGVIGILTGPALAPIDDVPGSYAPTLDHRDVGIVLKGARHLAFPLRQQQALESAEALRKKWTWQERLSFLMKEIRRLS